jgi:HK97 family phage prohead protease
VTEPLSPVDAAVEQTIAEVAAALLADAAVSEIVSLIGELPGLSAAAVRPVFTAMRWTTWVNQTVYDVIDGDSPPDIVRANDVDAAARAQAAYLVRGSLRVATAYATGDRTTIEKAEKLEQVYRNAHDAAQVQRAEAAEALAENLEISGDEPDTNGEILRGWDSEVRACDRGCQEAHGKNFNALIRPRIGYPGQVHPNCKCRSVAPWNTSARVDDVALRSRRSHGMTIETRAVPASTIELREPGDPGQPKGFTARVVNYGVRDSYGTSWAPGVFSRSLREKLPSVVWGHDWNDPIGRTVAYREVPASGADRGGLEIDVELDDFDAVPKARQAYAQLKSGTMKEFSFAFIRGQSRPDPELRDTIQIVDADVDEFSVVLNGSVPGTAVQAIRSKQPGGEIAGSRAAEILTEFASGRLTLSDAFEQCRTVPTISGDPGNRPGARFEIRATGDQESVDPMAVFADVLAKLADLSVSLDGGDIKAARRFFSNASSTLWELTYLLGMADAPLPSDGYEFYARQEGETRTLAWRLVEQPDAQALAEDAEVLAALTRLTS